MGFMVSTTTGKGGGKGAEEQTFPGLTILDRGERLRIRACCLCPGMVLRDCVWLTGTHTFPFSPTHPYDHRATEATQKASRQRSKLAEASQKGEKGRGK